MKRFEVSPSLVISLVALFVALGGGAYAALGPNSVGPAQLKRGAVTSKALRQGSVTQAKIRAGAVGAKQLRARSVGAGKIRGSLPGTLVAYAHVTPDGVVEERSWRIDDSNVAQMPISQYCLFGLPKYRTAMVTAGSNRESGVIANLDLPPLESHNCNLVAKDALGVATLNTIGVAPTNWSYEPFYIYLFK